ncbi:endonuclease III domain-containing protein [Syntrophorhabdus aromaticivorans]|uniref:Endonuclease III n=1 Tax=Syntrophorhabdus aromaticivorans TaxID=328301 RepID=A0A351U1S5_9BACT|nr:endonuclease III [Syntrophorhabdus aromaticivorans]NLW36799.1 endonuclease III [Syntrophorhabdus aromaticivorans]HBA53906.1 endonuclease III [Syntrophorhabdus aromaticivorans]
MKNFPFKEMIGTLKNAVQGDVPVVTRISRSDGGNPFLILVSTLLSLRTKDETTDMVMQRLVERAATPEDILEIPLKELETILYPVGFYRNKATVLKAVSRTIIEQYGGVVPDTIEELLTIKGVGRKTANLVVTEAYGKPGICVDTHVHRISNRMGIVATRNPHETEEALRKILPKEYWIIYNTLLVAFGRKTCKPVSPFCTVCPVVHLCKQAGVTRHR